jgi:hypothetical protein
MRRRSEVEEHRHRCETATQQPGAGALTGSGALFTPWHIRFELSDRYNTSGLTTY